MCEVKELEELIVSTTRKQGEKCYLTPIFLEKLWKISNKKEAPPEEVAFPDSGKIGSAFYIIYLRFINHLSVMEIPNLP